MNRITVDDALRLKLEGLKNQLELCDESGQTLGYFVTPDDYHYWIREWAKLKYPEDELERRFREPGGRTTAEVLARLQQL